MSRRRARVAIAAAVLTMAACGDDAADDGAERTLTMIVYDSYPPDDPDAPNPLQVALDEFTAASGFEVVLLASQDAGTMVSKAALTSGNPEGDVLWGVDNTLLSRALDAGVFEPYRATGLDRLDPAFTGLVPGTEATPVDFGDVCVNYDVAALAAAGLPAPTSMAELAEPAYASRLVVQSPATSSPGLAFLMATVVEFGEDPDSGWERFWTELVANDVLVVDSWTDAYTSAFTRAGGDRPLVVSYGSSPPFEVLFAAEPAPAAPTAVVESTCFRQVEFAGILRGTDQPEAAGRLIDFLISERFQRELPLNLFVFPVNPDVTLDPVFVEHAAIPEHPLTIEPTEIDANRADWIDRWTRIAG